MAKDINLKRIANKEGCATVRFVFNDHCRCTKSSHFNSAGQLCLMPDETSRWVKRYDDHGNVMR